MRLGKGAKLAPVSSLLSAGRCLTNLLFGMNINKYTSFWVVISNTFGMIPITTDGRDKQTHITYGVEVEATQNFWFFLQGYLVSWLTLFDSLKHIWNPQQPPPGAAFGPVGIHSFFGFQVMKPRPFGILLPFFGDVGIR